MTVENNDLHEQIVALKVSLDKVRREMADGVREWIDLREAYTKVYKENVFLREAAIKAITVSSNTSEDLAKKMLDEWFKTVAKSHKD